MTSENTERVRRIELPSSAWKAEVLPLNYTRAEPLSRTLPEENTTPPPRVPLRYAPRGRGQHQPESITLGTLPRSCRKAGRPGAFSFRHAATYTQPVRDVAQFGSAPALGAGGRGFKSRRPDRTFFRLLQPRHIFMNDDAASWQRAISTRPDRRGTYVLNLRQPGTVLTSTHFTHHATHFPACFHVFLVNLPRDRNYTTRRHTLFP